MKSYSLDDNRRMKTAYAFLGAAIFISQAIYWIIQNIPKLATFLGKENETWFEYLVFGLGTILPIVGVIYFFFNRYMWKWPLVNKLAGVPDLNGTWIGSVNRKEYPSGIEETGAAVVLEIRQRYFEMSAQLINKEEDTISKGTFSGSETLGISGNEDSGFSLDFIFRLKSEDHAGYGANMLRYEHSEQSDCLTGEYVSNYPRKGTLTVHRLKPNQNLYWGRIEELTSRSGEKYFGVAIPFDQIKKYDMLLKHLFEGETYQNLASNRRNRDGDKFHLTVVSPPETELLSQEDKKSFSGKSSVFYALTGIGHANKNGADAYFVTVQSPHCAYHRAQLGLIEKDFHVTLGFNPNDIYDVPKGHSTWLTQQP